MFQKLLANKHYSFLGLKSQVRLGQAQVLIWSPTKLENIGTQGVQELFFVNKKPLEVANGAYQSIVKP